MELTREEERILSGAEGEWKAQALGLQVEIGRFFGARRLVPVSCAHMVGDIEVMGDAGYAFLAAMAARQARCAVPSTTNARCVDFEHACRLRQDPAMVEKERGIIAAMQALGIATVDTCINYQTLYQPSFGEHLAWGDTGTVIWANSVIGARSNFEAGPAALAAALTGRTPAYGYHLPEQRLGTVLVEVEDEPADLADWGALGAWVGRQVNDYWQVPVLAGLRTRPSPDALKHLGAALASYGSLAMFHLVGVTPEAPTLTAAFGGREPRRRLVLPPGGLEAVYRSYPADRAEVDLVVFSGPQLSLMEVRQVAELLGGRKVHPNTHLIVTTNAQNKAAAQKLGYVQAIEAAGGLVLEGVCFYLMAIGEMRQAFGWRNLLTNSAKVANIVGGYRYHPIFRRTRACIEAAVRGRLEE